MNEELKAAVESALKVAEKADVEQSEAYDLFRNAENHYFAAKSASNAAWNKWAFAISQARDKGVVP
jgi:hypothetical protein